MTYETFDQGDEDTWPGQHKDDDKDKHKDKDKDKGKDKDKDNKNLSWHSQLQNHIWMQSSVSGDKLCKGVLGL